MNADLMRNYVQYVADYILEMLHMEPLYGTTNPVSTVLLRV